MTTRLESFVESGRLRRTDLALAQWIARAFPDSGDDVTLAAALAARAVGDGHSALELDRAQAWLDGLAQGDATRLPDAAAWRDALRASSAVQDSEGTTTDLRPLVLDAQGRVYLRRYFSYETSLAHALIARSHDAGTGARVAQVHESRETRRSRGSPSAPSAAPTSAPASSPRSPGSRLPSIDPEQQRAIDIALARRFALVTGGPGTGKTWVVVRILAALAQAADARGETLRIALAAPTGKAAARLNESLQAQRAALALPPAIDALLPTAAYTVHRLLGLSPWSARPRHHREAPLAFDVVVVDEVSMVDLPLMAKLVDAVSPEARLILLGDPDQLAAVEAGDVLGALVASARAAPLATCHAALARSHRFGSDSTLGELARAIARKDADAALAALGAGGAVTRVDAGVAGVVDGATEAYRAVLDASDPAGALAAARGFRVLTALRHGPDGCIAIDRAIAARLQQHAGVRADEQAWRGRLVLITANRPELDLYNGDTGVIWQNAQGPPRAWFESGAGAPRALPLAALPPHEGAFALTVHKAQGSEFERVALVTGPKSPVLTRELLYTGVTRARAGLTVHSDPDTLRAGIARGTLRMTGLAERVREAAGT